MLSILGITHVVLILFRIIIVILHIIFISNLLFLFIINNNIYIIQLIITHTMTLIFYLFLGKNRLKINKFVLCNTRNWIIFKWYQSLFIFK